MPDDMERMLRNSLDAVDRGRRWAMLGVAALFVAALLLLLASLHLGLITEEPGASRVLFHALGSMILFTACCTAVLMLHMTRMTKTILRAIEIRRD